MNKKYILFLNRGNGLDFVLAKALDTEKIKYEYISYKEEGSKETYDKYNVRTTPVLILLENGEESKRIVGVDDIKGFFIPVENKKKKKDVQDPKI